MTHGSASTYTNKGCRCDPCREAERLRKQAHVATRAAYIRQRRTELGPCARCGSPDNLEFDHIDPATKRYKLDSMKSCSIATIEEEIAKCQVLCRTCHIAKTKEAGDYTRWRDIGNARLLLEPEREDASS